AAIWIIVAAQALHGSAPSPLTASHACFHTSRAMNAAHVPSSYCRSRQYSSAASYLARISRLAASSACSSLPSVSVMVLLLGGWGRDGQGRDHGMSLLQ